MLAPNPWHEPERDARLPESDSGVMIGFVVLVLAAFGGAMLTAIAIAVF